MEWLNGLSLLYVHNNNVQTDSMIHSLCAGNFALADIAINQTRKNPADR